MQNLFVGTTLLFFATSIENGRVDWAGIQGISSRCLSRCMRRGGCSVQQIYATTNERRTLSDFRVSSKVKHSFGPREIRFSSRVSNPAVSCRCRAQRRIHRTLLQQLLELHICSPEQVHVDVLLHGQVRVQYIVLRSFTTVSTVTPPAVGTKQP